MRRDCSHFWIEYTSYSFLLNDESIPRCVAYDCDLTVEHILIKYGDFAEGRQRYFDVENLRLSQEISVTTSCFGLQEEESQTAHSC